MGGGGSGQGSSRRSGGGGTASAGGGGGSAAAAAGGGSSAAATADCSCHCITFFFTSDKEAFLCIRLRMTPQYSIDRSQRTVHNSWVIMHALHGHAWIRFTRTHKATPRHSHHVHTPCTQKGTHTTLDFRTFIFNYICFVLLWCSEIDFNTSVMSAILTHTLGMASAGGCNRYKCEAILQ